MTTINPGYTVVTDRSITTAGAIIWWRLSGDTDLTALRISWTHNGLNDALLPDNPSAVVALGRAAAAQADARRLIRPLTGGRGWAVVDETASVDGTLSYQQLATLTLNDSQMQVTHGAALSNVSPGLTDTELARLYADFDQYQRTLTVNDVSSWLSRLVKQELKCVSLRDTGGVYFVPRDHINTFHQMVKAISAATGHRMFEVPALKSDEAVDAILDAVLREADSECGAIETELDTGDLKRRALQSRQNKCEMLREKVEAYEALLGRSMTAVRERIDSLKASVVAAQLTLSAQEAA